MSWSGISFHKNEHGEESFERVLELLFEAIIKKNVVEHLNNKES